MPFSFLMPIKGKVSDVSSAPDPTFAKGLLGPGFVIHPDDHVVRAPVDGVIELIYPTKHVMAIRIKNGVSVMIHIGFDDRLRGDVIKMRIQPGEAVRRGDIIATFEPSLLALPFEAVAITVVFVQKKQLIIKRHTADNPRQYDLEVE